MGYNKTGKSVKKYILFLVLFAPLFKIAAQNKNEFNVKFTGFVNWTALYDSRKVVAARESHFLLYPKEELLSKDGIDLNKVENFNMAVIMTRFGAKVSAPEFLDAVPTAFVETEFMGNSDTDVNGLRIRHAYISLDWQNTSLLLGQTWSPMFIPEAFPLQIGSNGGAPIQPFARNPQIRITQTINNIKLIAALATQRDYSSPGPIGTSNEYLRNAVIPDLHFHIQYKNDKNLFGFGGQYKRLRPATETSTGYFTDNTVAGYSVQGYSKLVFDKFVFAAQGLYGTNLADATMLGGYAVESVNPTTGAENYTPIKIYSAWVDLMYGSDFRAGLFAGYTENLGTVESITGKFYARGSNIKSVYRIAPRIEYQQAQTKFCFETEYTNAAYGTPDSLGKINNAKDVGNLRLNFSVYYFF